MDIRSILVSAHSGIRWLVVLIGIIALVRFAMGWLSNGKYGELENRIWTALKMTLRLQFVLGVIVLILGATAGFGMPWLQVAGEHAVTNLIAIAVLEMMSARAKRGTADSQRFMLSMIGVLVAAVLIFLGVARVSGWS